MLHSVIVVIARQFSTRRSHKTHSGWQQVDFVTLRHMQA